MGNEQLGALVGLLVVEAADIPVLARMTRRTLLISVASMPKSDKPAAMEPLALSGSNEMLVAMFVSASTWTPS